MPPFQYSLRLNAEAAHPRNPGVRQARAAKVFCKGHQSSKAAVAAHRNAVAAEALFGRLDDELQNNIFTGRTSKVKPHFCAASPGPSKLIAKTIS